MLASGHDGDAAMKYLYPNMAFWFFGGLLLCALALLVILALCHAL